jgi:CheY-like chemotaxis protein
MRVLIATSGEAAIALLDHVTPDLILMDAIMPGMGGFEATRLIRAPRTTHIPIVFMTGLTESEHVLAALEAGGVDYVRKPLIVNELVARVRVHMANARKAVGSQAALDASGRHLISVARDETLVWWTPQAGELISQSIPDWSRTPGLARRAAPRADPRAAERGKRHLRPRRSGRRHAGAGDGGQAARKRSSASTTSTPPPPSPACKAAMR